MNGVIRSIHFVAILLILAGLEASPTVAQSATPGGDPAQVTTAENLAREEQAAQSTNDPHSGVEFAKELIERASDHISGATNLSIEAKITYDVPLGSSLMATYEGNVKVAVSRPGKLFIDYEDDRETFKVWINGKHVTYLDEIADHFSKMAGAATLEQTAGELFQTYGLVLPLSKLLLADVYAEILNGGPLISYLGKGRLDDAEVHHVVVHGGLTDTQLWINAGATPVLHKLVTVNRRQPLLPRFTATFAKFDLKDTLEEDLFEPNLSETSKATEFSRLRQ